MLILAGTVINYTVGDKGILSKAQDAVEKSKIASLEEKLELAKTELIMDKRDNITIKDYIGILEQEGIIISEDDVEDNEDGTYNVTTEEGYVFEVEVTEEGQINTEYIGKKDKLEPRIKEINIISKTTNSLEIEVNAKRAEGAKYTYSYKKESEEEWIKEETKESNQYKIEGLIANEIYVIHVKAENKNGSDEKEINVRMGELPKGAITIGEVEWKEGKAEVVVNINKEIEGNLRLEYKINEDGEWIEIQDGEKIENLELNQTVYVRLTDGINETEYASTSIKDTEAPTVSISTSNITQTSVRLSVTAEDNQSGLASSETYSYYLNDELKGSNNTNYYDYTELTANTGYTLKVIVKDKAGLTTTKTTTIKTDDYPIISAIDITNNASEYYGAEVTGYTCTNSAAVPKWRIFYADSTNIYLIADDYIPNQYAPNSVGGHAPDKNGTYKAYFSSVYGDYSGAEWISANSKGKKWLSLFLNSYGTSTNENIRVVAYMMDTNVWSTFAGAKAEYAMGGPTLELFCASYKQTHPSKYVECNYVDSNGYQVKLSTSLSYSDYISGLPQDDFNEIYIKSNANLATGMWLASPSSNLFRNLMHASYNGYVSSYDYYTSSCGFRPLVCLKSDVRLKMTSDGVYAIQ